MNEDRRRLLKGLGAVAGLSLGAGYLSLAPKEWPLSLRDPDGERGKPRPKGLRLPERGFAVEPSNVLPHLGVARGADVDAMLKGAVDAIGGIRRFVTNGDVVLVKPNVAFERSARDEDEGIEAPARGLGGDELTRTREARLALLARKYEGQASTEDVARIHLLTERLRRLDPRVTEGERRAAQEVVESLERVTLAVTNIRNEFGL
jgi:hypothetical protein